MNTIIKSLFIVLVCGLFLAPNSHAQRTVQAATPVETVPTTNNSAEIQTIAEIEWISFEEAVKRSETEKRPHFNRCVYRLVRMV